VTGQPTHTLQLTPRYRLEVHEDGDVPGWDDFVEAHAFGRHVQATSWARFQTTRGWCPIRLVAREGDAVVGVAQVLFRRTRFTGAIGYLDHGPLVAEDRPGLVDAMVHGVKQFAADRVRMLLVQPATDRVAAAMAAAGFSGSDPRISLPATIEVDLSHSESELLAGMKPKTRYNIRRGLRSGVTVRQGGSADVPDFHALLVKTGDRQGFTPNSLQYFVDLDRQMPEESVLFLAEDASGPIAGILLVGFGDRVAYKRGAWSGTAGNLHPNELLHWSAMLWAKHAGYRYYDFDGIDPHVAAVVAAGGPLPREALKSVSRFKLGFGGDIVMTPSSVGYIPNPVFRFAYDRVFTPLRHTGMARRLVKRLQAG
jgi:lipid II:glycine glycyltransferase (peptidoglycan interpeptide bridge formation enzyme)